MDIGKYPFKFKKRANSLAQQLSSYSFSKFSCEEARFSRQEQVLFILYSSVKQDVVL